MNLKGSYNYDKRLSITAIKIGIFDTHRIVYNILCPASKNMFSPFYGKLTESATGPING